ncbi:MAG: toxic anion resistance protein [Candidatus Kapabacteria bacterium]|nr:toxic anion resistance protein [Candidatus Kapabacteria bacterium]
MKNSETTTIPKVTSTYLLPTKLLEMIEDTRINKLPSVPFPTMVEIIATEGLKELTEDDFKKYKKKSNFFSFTKKFRDSLEELQAKYPDYVPKVSHVLEMSIAKYFDNESKSKSNNLI